MGKIMKFRSLLTLASIFSLVASAGVVTWETFPFTSVDFEVGDLAAIFRDVDDNNGSTTSGLVVNTDFSVSSSSVSPFADDQFLGFTSDLYTPGGGFLLLNTLSNQTMPDNAKIYTVFFNSSTLVAGSTLGAIVDSPTFNSGAAVPPATAVSYDPVGIDGTLSGALGGVTVIPEPTTIFLMIGGFLTVYGFRKHLRK
ncbi:MAG: PEP-CTERM sorting domain-containing protein [Kiritimatiellia bacterium]